MLGVIALLVWWATHAIKVKRRKAAERRRQEAERKAQERAAASMLKKQERDARRAQQKVHADYVVMRGRQKVDLLRSRVPVGRRQPKVRGEDR